MRFNTSLLHAGVAKETNGSTLPPVYQTSAFEQESAAALEKIFENKAPGYCYTRVANPTITAFENRITKLEGGIASVACASGMAALMNTFLNILSSGDELISSASLYGGTIDLFHDLEAFGITTRYVDPKNRDRQIEMEQACTEHLKEIGGYLAPEFKKIEFSAGNFEYEASVIIPVRNRIRTIRDAIKSVLMQKTDFKYNLIIIDNHSTDGTTEAIDEFKDDERVIHIIPERTDLGIGGCWNMGVHHPKCGKFAVQLDSDDVYKDENTLAIMVRAFYEQNCAMVVGTYMMTDFNMNMIAPGIIDHKEWTPANGRNNALRINGLGAPRAFYTPVLREVKVPNTSYGEDYALGLNFSRQYQIGRVYDVVYLCRRWDDNSDASLDIVKMNGHNLYKDRIRTWELQARIAMNKNK